MVLIAVYWFQPGGAHSLCVYSSREIFGRTIARFADRFARSSSHQVSLARSLATLYARLSLSSSSTLFHRFFVCSFDLSPSPSRVMNRYPWRHARQSAATRALNQGSSRSKPRPHDRSFDRTGYSNYPYIRTYISIYVCIYVCMYIFASVCTDNVYDAPSRYTVIYSIHPSYTCLFLLCWPFSKSRGRTKDWSGRGTSSMRTRRRKDRRRLNSWVVESLHSSLG